MDNYNNDSWNNNQNPQQNQNTYSAQDYQHHTVRKTIPHRIISSLMAQTTVRIILTSSLMAQATIKHRLISSQTITISTMMTSMFLYLCGLVYSVSTLFLVWAALFIS